jgi:hypothetical protein
MDRVERDILQPGISAEAACSARDRFPEVQFHAFERPF